MLHEILLSLSGHPSPLLLRGGADHHEQSPPASDAVEPWFSSSSVIISPSERRLLASAAHLSDLHRKLMRHSARITASHPSTVCRAVATAIQSVHLAALRRKVLDVEAAILGDDPALVGAYGIVPLTAVVGEFQPWTRRLEWLWEVVQFLEAADGGGPDVANTDTDTETGAGAGRPCWGARAIDRLRAELQSGYRDVEETARTLVAAAETAWLRQVSAWIFYGRLPGATTAGADDFFIRAINTVSPKQSEDRKEEHYVIVPELLPAFVAPATATSMLFIGRSLNQIRVRSSSSSVFSTANGFHNTAAKLQAIADLKSPLSSASFTGVIRDIRQSLSQDILEEILPLSQVMSTMQLLREFFLLGRGEFAMALTQEADERIRSRWRRAGNPAHEQDGSRGVQHVTVKNSEVSAVLARAWASLSSFEKQQQQEQEQQSDTDELLDRARNLLRLQLVKEEKQPEAATTPFPARSQRPPFDSLLFSVPVALAMQLPPAVDIVISPLDMQVYCDVHAYLMSLRRAHIRLTDLWKLTSLRRHYPGVVRPNGVGSPSADDARRQQLLRERWSRRARVLRGTWTAASAAIFFLGETEAYFQTEVVEGLWRGFRAWLTGERPREDDTAVAAAVVKKKKKKHVAAAAAAIGDEMDVDVSEDDEDDDEDDVEEEEEGEGGLPDQRSSWTTDRVAHASSPRKTRHDQQTLSAGHAIYLATLLRRLLLTRDVFTRPLYALLVHIDHLVVHVRRLHAVFTAADLDDDNGNGNGSGSGNEDDEEERVVLRQLRRLEGCVRAGIDDVVAALETLSVDDGFLRECEGAHVGLGDDGGSAGAGAGAGDGGGDDGQDHVRQQGTVVAVAVATQSDDLGPGEAYRPERVGGLNRLLMQLRFGS